MACTKIHIITAAGVTEGSSTYIYVLNTWRSCNVFSNINTV
jgi:hypothetical protein